MTHISIIDASVDLPIFDAASRSIKNQFVSFATGGRISKSETGKVSVRAIDTISVEIGEGDRIGVVGHNGAGKSTFLKMLSGVYVPTSGWVQRSGTVASLIDIGLGINPEATGRENIILRGLLLGMSKREVTEKLEEIIEFTELGQFIELPARTYSSGMLMRLAVSVATVVRADILVMDEWLSVGDVRFVDKVRIRLDAMVQGSDILILASHDLKLIQESTNKTIWLDHGKVRAFDLTSTVVNEYMKSL